MSTDILSSLNTSGSGMNLAQLATDLTNAETLPKRTIIEGKIEDAETSVSALAMLRSEVEGLTGNLALVSTGQSLNAITSSDDFTAEITDSSVAEQVTSRIQVNSLAESQVLQFAGFEGRDAAVDAGTLTIDFGSWDDSTLIHTFTQNTARDAVEITVTEGMTLQELANELNAIDGVTARVIDVGDGTFTLGLASDTGANNAIRMTATPDAAPSGTNIDLMSFDTLVANSEHQLTGASDAELLLNGITVFRETNEIDDLLPGINLTLNSVTDGAQTLSVETNDENAYLVMGALVAEFNKLGEYMRTVTARGITDDTRGELAGDTAADTLRRQFESTLQAGFAGFGDRPYYLADLGIETMRDGTMIVNETKFKEAFNANPAIFDAMLQDGLKADNTDVKVTGTLLGGAEAGQYSFVRDPVTGDATLNGVELVANPQDDGTIRYTATTGEFKGISITVPDGIDSATISYGRSLISTLSENLETALEDNGLIGRRERNLADEISEQSEELDELDVRAEYIEARYLQQFTAMETIITQLNNTGTYLENLVNAWEAEAG